jgi:endonuclease YncB( thermonuclease family)
MWFILSLVIGAALFGGRTHEFSSVRHFETEKDCLAYLARDTDELEVELMGKGLARPYRIEARCEQDGTPA